MTVHFRHYSLVVIFVKDIQEVRLRSNDAGYLQQGLFSEVSGLGKKG